MISGLFAGAAVGLLAILVLLVRPGLCYRLAGWLELAARGRTDALVRLAVGLALFGGVIGALTGA